ncbi:MAG: bacillithiol biosynthesis deacetylase BshB1 [Bacteroidetes bacterium]|nr:bacillithiol biosynthesis deacetylase BshB1 [Bacteroidota bacterium]
MNRLDILGIAAHPDDVELSCAGTFLAAKRSGKRTGILDLTLGELSTRGTLETRAQETAEASRILELDYRANLQFSDGNIPVDEDSIHAVIRQIRATRPSIVFCPHFSERHPDHEAAAELTHRAAFYSGLAKIETLGEDGKPQEPYRPLLVLHFMQTYVFEPKIIMDVTNVFDDRLRCVQAYGSQFGRGARGAALETNERETFLTQKGFYEWIEARARHYGMQIGAQFGEPFWCQGTPGVTNIFDIVTKRIA